jgi:ribonuclease-3
MKVSDAIHSVSGARWKKLLSFQRRLGVRFKSLELLHLAFVHSSITNEIRAKENNERLEFLGDSILGAVASAILYRDMAACGEGELSRVKAIVVSEEVLSGIALELGLDTMMVLGRGEELTGGRSKKGLLADTLEALFGALYLDSGYEAAFGFISRCIAPEIEKARERKGKEDYKTHLQELCQRKYNDFPSYRLARHSGPAHERRFWVEVICGGKTYGPGIGGNKKAAEQEAARLALSQL